MINKSVNRVKYKKYENTHLTRMGTSNQNGENHNKNVCMFSLCELKNNNKKINSKISVFIRIEIGNGEEFRLDDIELFTIISN